MRFFLLMGRIIWGIYSSELWIKSQGSSLRPVGDHLRQHGKDLPHWARISLREGLQASKPPARTAPLICSFTEGFASDVLQRLQQAIIPTISTDSTRTLIRTLRSNWDIGTPVHHRPSPITLSPQAVLSLLSSMDLRATSQFHCPAPAGGLGWPSTPDITERPH